VREDSGVGYVAYHHDGCDVIWFGMEWEVSWYSGMTPIIDWYAITTTVVAGGGARDRPSNRCKLWRA